MITRQESFPTQTNSYVVWNGLGRDENNLVTTPADTMTIEIPSGVAVTVGLGIDRASKSETLAGPQLKQISTTGATTIWLDVIGPESDNTINLVFTNTPSAVFAMSSASAGEVGPIGPQGPKGDDGEKGDTGEVGPIGPQGPKGDDGEKGDTGDTGPQGIPGEDGADGLCALVCTKVFDIRNMGTQAKSTPLDKFNRMPVTGDVATFYGVDDTRFGYITGVCYTVNEEVGYAGFEFDDDPAIITTIEAPAGSTGPQGLPGQSFEIYNTYSSYMAAENDIDNVPYGQYVLISNTQSQDHGDLYCRPQGANQYDYIGNIAGPRGYEGANGQDGLTTSITVNGETFYHQQGNIEVTNVPSVEEVESANRVIEANVTLDIPWIESTVNNSYYCDVQVSGIHEDDNPIGFVKIDPATMTQEEMDELNKINIIGGTTAGGYITLYAKEAPTVNFTYILKGK